VSPRARRTLADRTILVTRPREHSSDLVAQLERRGARTIEAPTIELVPVRSAALTRALRDLRAGRFAWVTLTSPRTIDVLASRMDPEDVRAEVAAIGDGTAAAFRSWTGRDPDLVPRAFTTAALARSFPRRPRGARGSSGGSGPPDRAARVLCARADIAPEGLEAALQAKGWSAERVDAYRTRMAGRLPLEAREALAGGEVDAVTFTSASTVRGFVGAVGRVKGHPKVVCIGPVTAKEARVRGLPVAAVARPHTVAGLVEALERALR
jgi:uroporphyrinogen-III synthase